MKTKGKILSLFLVLTLILGLIPMNGIGAFATGGTLSGSGTAEDPYLIYDAKDLAAFRDSVNGGSTTICGILMNDINLNGGYTFKDDGTYTGGSSPVQWTPIGNNSTKFVGTFDGDGHKVSGLYINNSADNQGLFGFIETGSAVKNLGIENSYIKGKSKIGGVAGYCFGEVQNCYNESTVIGTSQVGGIIGDCNGNAIGCKNEGTVSGDNSIGGIVGNIYFGKVEDCQNTGKVSGTGDHVGGVVGYNNANYVSVSVKHCKNEGTVSGAGRVGGVVGHSYSGKVEDSYNTGAVSGTFLNVGGVVGRNSGTVENCYNTGAVSGTNNSVGGVIGRNSGTVENCCNSGTVSSTMDYVGGVIGYNDGTVSNCYNIGAVSGTGDYVGGVAGNNSSTVENCYNTGAVSGTGDYVGGVIGYNNRTVKNCYYLNGTAQKGIGNAEDSDTTTKALSVAQMTGSAAKNNMTGFDFDSVWTVGNNNSGWSYVGANDETTGKYQYGGQYPQLRVFEDNGFVSGKAEEIGLQQEEIDGKTFYLIYNNAQLETFRNIVNGTLTDDEYFYTADPAVNGKLMADIDLNEGYIFNDDGTYTGGSSPAQWTPIGNDSIMFAGTFDGNGHSVSGVYINSRVNDQGLFGFTETGSAVKNLSIENSYIKGGRYVGGVAGFNNGTVENCYNTGAVSGLICVGGVIGNIDAGAIENCYNTGAVSGNQYVGGVVGRSINTVENCYNAGAVIGTSDYVGGVAGFNNGVVENCYNTGVVSGTGNNVGGVAGYNSNNGTFKNCCNTGTVNGKNNVGGVVGLNASGTVTNCHNTGTVSSEGRVGGVVGYNSGTVANCYNAGAVSGGDRVGGVVGQNYDGAVANCYNAGTVSSTMDYVGGVIGENSRGTVENCYNTGAVSGTVDYVGGVAGNNSSTVSNCYNIGAVSGTGYVGSVIGYNNRTVKNCYYLNGTAQKGIGNAEDSDTTTKALSVAQMTGSAAKNNMTGFDFDSVWTVGNNNSGWSYVGANDETTGKYQYGGQYPQLRVFEDNGFISGEAEAIGLQQEEIDGKTFYLIYNNAQLETFRNIVNGTLTDDEYFYTPDPAANGKLMADIDLNEGYTFNDDGTYTGGSSPAQWTPIGNYDKHFNGTFDGSGYKVSGVYINGSDFYQGLFGFTETGSVVKNLGIENSYIKGELCVGGVVGFSNGTVEDCYNTGVVSGTGYYVGGIVGYNDYYGTVTNCYNTGAVSGEGDYVGGVVGYNGYYGTLTNCYNTGAVSGTNYVGGVAGYNISTITNCYYLNGTAQRGIGNNEDSDTTAKALSVAEIENDLLAMLKKDETGAWADECGKMGDWEYGKPAVQPIFTYQVKVDNVPAYTVTIPEYAEVGGSPVQISAEAGELRANQQLYVRIDDSTELTLTLDGEDDKIVFVPYLVTEEKDLSVGDTVLETNNTKPNETATTDIGFKLKDDEIKYAGTYTGTVTFTVSLEAA